MAEEDKSGGLNIAREQMLEWLNEDLVREFQAMVEINRHIDCLRDEPGVVSDSVNTSQSPVEMLRAVLENERKTAEHYRERIHQAETMGEFELGEILRTILARQHKIDLSAVLGGKTPPPNSVCNLLGAQ
jgi:bacterioferritin (cytochrome b1)